MGGFFSRDNWVWKPFSWVADVLLLSGLWFVCSVLMVTMGGGFCALYDCVARCVRGDDPAMFRRFFRTFRRELIPGAVYMAVWALVIGGGYKLIAFYGNHTAVTDGAVVVTVALLLLLSAVVGVACWSFVLQSRFTMTLGKTLAMTLRLGLGYLPRTLIMGIVTVTAGYFCLQFFLPFLFLPMPVVLVWNLMCEPVLQRFMQEAQS